MIRLAMFALTMMLSSVMALTNVAPTAAQQLVFESFPASAVVRGENIRLRLDPALETEVESILQRGDPITITGEAVIADGDEFYPVESDLTGETGWIRVLFIDPRGIATDSTVVVPLDDVESADDGATQDETDREARRQARQADAEQEPEPEPETENGNQNRADRRAARQEDSAAAEAETEEPANDRAARRAERQAAQDANGDAGNASSDELTFSGSESTVTPEFTVPSDVLTVTASHEGDGNFSVLAYTPEGIEELLFNEIGPYSGETALEIDPDSAVILDVEANGPWEVVIEPTF